MTTTEPALCWVYGPIALAALIGTQAALVDFLRSDKDRRDVVSGPAATFTALYLLARTGHLAGTRAVSVLPEASGG